MKFTEEQIERIYALIEKLTGTCQQGKFRKTNLLSNITKRMNDCAYTELEKYLDFVKQDPNEHQYFLSNITIHTTSWFREKIHFEELKKYFQKNYSGKVKILCIGCSDGHEVYSLALLFEQLRANCNEFDYSILGVDIDPISLKTAAEAVYPVKEIDCIPLEYRKNVLIGSGNTEGWITLTKEIRSRCSFESRSITDESLIYLKTYDLVICRNLLIYFEEKEFNLAINRMSKSVKDNRLLCLGHAEAVDLSKHETLSKHSNSIYIVNKQIIASNEKTKQKTTSIKVLKQKKKPRVLILDDSKTIRKKLVSILKEDFLPIEASSFSEAERYWLKQKIDLMTLDLHMPDISGQESLKRFRRSDKNTPVIILSGAEKSEAIPVLGALSEGAQSFISKAQLNSETRRLIEEIHALINKQNNLSVIVRPNASLSEKPNLVLIGASTGGPIALVDLLSEFQAVEAPIVIVQHIPAEFSPALAERLSIAARKTLCSGQSGEELKNNHLYMALDDYHLEIKENGGKRTIEHSQSPKVSGHRPSVDELFLSAIDLKSIEKITAVILTGMGSDGAQGLLQLKKKGAFTMGQCPESSVVWGMPGKAHEYGAVQFMGTPKEIGKTINKCFASPIKQKIPK